MFGTICLAAASLANVLWTKPICQEPKRYLGWPTVCLCKNGELITVFSGDRDAHVCPFGKVQLIRSADGGETWTAPVTIRNSSLDDRDAGIIELKDGTLLVNSFSSVCFARINNEMYKRIFEKIPYADVCRDIGYFSWRSTDGGKTWEEPVRMNASSPHGGIQLKDGRLFVVGRRTNSEGNMMHPKDPANKGHIHDVLAEISSDGGRSWQVFSYLKPQSPYKVSAMHEPHVIECDDGTLVVQIRYHEGPHRTIQCESHDGGKSWGTIHETGIPGFPSYLLKLADGRFLSSYARRDANHWGVYAVLSTDNGKTWDVENAITLSTHYNHDLGYPATVQLADGSLVTVFYQAAKRGEKTSIMATKWRLK